MGENLSNVSPARINDLVYKLDGKYSKEAVRKLVVIGKNPKTKQQLITILQEKRKEFTKESDGIGDRETYTASGANERARYYSNLADKTNRVLKEIQKNFAK